jgi:hypothetical protein
MRSKAFTVKVKISPLVDEEMVRDYIEEAVNSWNGQFEPDNPLFDIKDAEVTYRKHKP